MWHDAVLVAGKDLRIEARARVALWQVVPFAVLVLVLLAFAIGPNQSSLRHAAPGIFWVALLFSTVLAIQRSVAVESGEGTRATGCGSRASTRPGSSWARRPPSACSCCSCRSSSGPASRSSSTSGSTSCGWP